MLQKAIIGKKVGMTQIFNADGKVIPCTVTTVFHMLHTEPFVEIEAAV